MSKVNTADSNVVKPLVAADLLKSDHPLNKTFLDSLSEGTEPTKRQARKFLAENPRYRTAVTA